MDKQLSIIIPVYNVEKYIRPCIESILRQGLKEDGYEIILVNDGTKDRSMEQIASFIDSHDNITVIEQKNQGLSVSRNNGLAIATGEYVMFMDSDDLLFDNSLTVFLDKALTSKADIVAGDFLKMTDDEISELSKYPVQQDIRWEEKTGEESFLQMDNCSACVALFKRSFLTKNHILFIPNIICEDIPFTHECWLKSEKSVKTNLPLIIYRMRSGSITHSYSFKDFSTWGIAFHKTWELRKQVPITPTQLKKLESNIFWRLWNVAIPAIMDCFGSLHDRIRAMRFLSRSAPDLRSTINFNQRAITFLYRHSPRLLMLLLSLKNK